MKIAKGNQMTLFSLVDEVTAESQMLRGSFLH